MIEMFKNRIDALLAGAGSRQAEAQREVDALLAGAPDTTDKFKLGAYVGPKLKQLEVRYAPPAAPEPPSRTQDEKLQDLAVEGVLNGDLRRRFEAQRGQPGFGRTLDAAYGQLEKTRAGDCPDKTLLVGAYTQVCGYLFERSRVALAMAMPEAAMARRESTTKVKVSFRGLGELDRLSGRRDVVNFKNIAIDNDVPVIPRRIWETKWYVRKNYGADHSAINQVLKYQAACDQGLFDSVTLEVHGNIDHNFLRALCEGREVAPGLELFAPDVELIYALDEQVSVTLKASRHAKSLARSNETAPAVRLAVLDKKYDTFSNSVLQAADLQGFAALKLLTPSLSMASNIPEPLAARLQELLLTAVRDDFVDPERITSVPAFQLYEQLVIAKRREAWGLR
jgi:hypothetical protein